MKNTIPLQKTRENTCFKPLSSICVVTALEAANFLKISVVKNTHEMLLQKLDFCHFLAWAAQVHIFRPKHVKIHENTCLNRKCVKIREKCDSIKENT